MSVLKRATATIGAGAVLAVPVAGLISSPAHADVERNGRCGTGTYQFSVDREGRGFEIGAGLERVAPGSRWRITLTHDGERFFGGVLRADNEGEIDVDRYRGNTAGGDAFTFRAKRLGSSASCGATVNVR